MKAYLEGQTSDRPRMLRAWRPKTRGHHRYRSDHMHRYRRRKFLAWNPARKKAASTASPASTRACSMCVAPAKFAIGMPEDFFSPHRLKRLDRYAQFAVASAKLALDDARIDYSREKPQDRVGVSFGTALGGVCKAEEQHIRFLKKGARGVQPDACPASLRWLGAFEHRDRIWISRRRHDEFKQLRQRHSLGRRSAALHSRRFCRCRRRRRSRSAADCHYYWRVRYHQNNEQMGR